MKPVGMQAPLSGGTALVLLLLAIAFAAAGASDRAVDWSFEVLEVSPEPGGHLVRLKPMPPGRKFPRSCETFVVHATYAADGGSRNPHLTISRQGHEDALRYLERAEASRKIVRFGSVGRGFAAIADSPRCEVASQALVSIVKSDGRAVVFSVFGSHGMAP
jgi:hypothetical protein